MKKIKLMALLFVSMLSINLWGTDLTPSFSFTSCPSGWPSGSGVTAGTTKTYTVSSTSYTFTLGANVYYNTSKYLMLKSTTYLGLPAVNGYKLTGVSITNSSGCSKSTKVAITTASDGKTNVTGGDAQTFSTTSKTYSYTLSNTTANTSYYLYITSANCQIVTIALTYTAATPSGPTLESIYFTNDAATKLSYTEGDVFDPTGLVVMGKYSEGDDKAVTADVEWSFNPATLAKTTSSVTVTASIDGVDDAQKVVNGLTVAAAPKFTKVTANKTDWSGEYLLVYEKDGTAYVWTGVDASNSYATATITSNQIAKPATAAKLIIASMTGGYSIQVSGGDNDGKYVDQTKYDNGMSISDSPSANTLSHDGTNTVIAGSGASGDSHVTMRYNNTSGQDRFRYYKSGQQAIQLYEKVLDPISSAVTFSAPEGGSLVIKNGATPIATGATIQDGTVLDVTFGMTPAEAYKDVVIKVTKTEGGDDVTSTVYNSETQKITMPRYPITVAVTFTKLYKIEAATVTGGTFSWEDANHAKPTYVEVGALIQASQEAATHYEFKSFDIYKTGAPTTKVEDADGLFEMPAYDVTIGGIFEEMQCTALPSAPVLGTPSISYADGVTLNWNKLDAASGYLINVWKGTDKIVEDEMIEDVNTLSYKITATMGVNTEYSYSIAGLGDDETYCMLGNPANQSTFTTADYPAVVLTLSENGITSTKDGKLNTAITLPTESTQACDGKVFMGWSEDAIEGEVGKDQVTLLDATYTFTDPEQLTKTIYAVYAKETAGETQKYTLDYTTDVSSKTLGYGSAVEVTASDGSEWVVKASKQQGMQINTGKNASIKIPTCPQNITSIEVTGTAEKAVGLSAEDYSGSGTITYIAYGTDAKEQVIDLTNKSVNSGYIVGKSGANPITKIVVNYEGESSYSKYCTTCEAAIAVPTFSLAEGEYDEAKTLTLSAAEGDIYYTINDGEETKYTAAIALNNRGTYEISAYAKVDDRTSDVVTKTYTLDWPYTLDELAASDVADGTTVEVTFENKEITNFYTNSQGKRYGIYVNVQKGGKDVEIYCNKAEHPNTWEVGGKVSSAQAISGTWTYYSGGSQWEFCPSNWDNISYTAPAKITSLVINNDVTNKNYTAGQKLDFTGLTVTGVYSDATEEDVTEDVVWTEVTLTENQTAATATATLNNAKTGNIAVSQSKSITGLTVGAAKTLDGIYVADDSKHKTEFFVGRPFSAEGLKVMARYNMGDDQQIALANLTIDNPTFSAAEAEHTINISYTENEVEKSTSYKVSVGYMNLSDLVAEDIPTNTSVKVAFSNVEITGFYTNKSEQRTGVYVNVKGKNDKNIELYYNTPSTDLDAWQEGGLLATKNAYISGTWSYYENGEVWEITFTSGWDWDTNLDYTAPSIYPTGIAMSIPSATVKQSKSLDLDAIFTPTNATVLNNLEWSSDNNQVTVAPSQDKKSAKVTVAPAATVGTATITVKVDDKDGNELSATCVITIQEYAVPRYGLYSGAIEEGDYIFKADGAAYFMNNTNNNGRLANVANESNPEIVNNIITTDAESFVWQIAKSGDYWTIKNLATQTYVISTASSKASLSDSPSDNTEKWTITYDETNEVYTFANLGRSESTSEPTKCYLRNNNNNGWACYASGTGNAITLYKAGFTPAAALQSIEIKGDLEITEYFQGKSVKYDGLTVEGTYSDGDKKTITEGIVWSANPATFTEKGDNISVTITATVQTKNGEITDDANFTVKVVESQKVSYGLVTSVNTLYDGATIILGAVFGTATDPIYAVNQGFDTKYLAAYRSNTEGSDLEYENEVMKTAYASEITLKKAEEGWKLLGEDGKYINGAGDLSQTTDVAEATVWTITIEEDVAKIASGSNIIYYNTSSPRFKTYTSAQQEIGIYMKNLVAIRTGLTAGKIGTICYPQAIAAVDGANLYQPNYKDDAVKNIYFSTPDEYKAGLPMIFQADREIMKVLFTGEEAPLIEDLDVTRGMVGSFEDNVDVPEGAYIFTQNKLWIAGVGCKVDKNRAYVDLSQVPFSDGQLSHDMPSGAPRRTICLGNGSASTPTGVNNLREGDAVNTAQKFFINGNIVIKNQGQLYNAQGNKLK